MFFIGVFGVNNKHKVLKEVKFDCTGCLSKKSEVIVSYRSFEFFFVPIFKFNKKYLLKCKKCGSLYKLKQEHMKDILKYEEVKYKNIEKIIYEIQSCKHCGERSNEKFEYCPRCGKKL